jgi:hypothetical protein
MRRSLILGSLVIGCVLTASGIASATTIPISEASMGPVLIDFGAVQTLAPINGVTIGGVLFNFSISGVPSVDAIIDDGPGNTNHVAVANIEGNTLGVLTLTFPGLESRFGFGYAISTSGAVLNSTHVDLFDAVNTLLGGLSFNGVNDPAFTGGFAGIGSTIPFAKAQVTFNSAAAARFAFDNVRFDAQPVSAVPEPASAILIGTGLAAAALRRRRQP